MLRAGIHPWPRTIPLVTKLPLGPLGVTALLTISSAEDSVLTWHTLQSALKRSLVVEGVVQDLHPMPFEGHDYEHFTVGGVLFNYPDYAYSGGFNQSKSHGGPVTSGLTLRIHYIYGRDGDTTVLVIVKLEQKCGSG
jgi:hypothetical protein